MHRVIEISYSKLKKLLDKHRKSVCPKCFEFGKLERHHIYPQQFFGGDNVNPYVLRICTECHNDIEKCIPKSTKLTKLQYRLLHRAWLNDNPILMKMD